MSSLSRSRKKNSLLLTHTYGVFDRLVYFLIKNSFLLTFSPGNSHVKWEWIFKQL